jgi:hypothetical protein
MADAEGYRQSDDAPASNEILRSIIFNKLPLLNSPGELIPNTLYYDARNCSVQAAEQTNFFGRDRIAFNNKNFGSTPSVHIPNVFFTNTCFVVMELEYEQIKWKAEAEKDEYGNYFYMPHGWGFHLLDNIVYYLGSSSVANIQISGTANLIWHLATCETLSKKQKMLTGAGKFLNTQQSRAAESWASDADPTHYQISAPVGQQFLFRNYDTSWPIYSSGVKYETPNVVDPRLALAIVPIRLPFSSVCALEKRISFDTKLLQQPIQITLGLKTADNIMSISPTTSFLNSTYSNLTTSLKSLTFQSFQQGLSDQSLSLRNELLANPRFSVGVPFQYIQDMRFNVLSSQGATGTAGSAGSEYFVNITSMLNADLTTIQFALMWDQDQKALTNNRFAPLNYIKMDNIQLLLNGQRLHNYDNESYSYVYLANAISNGWASVMSSTPSDQDGSGAMARKYHKQNRVAVYEINFSRLRAAAMESHMMNTPRFTNQTMQLAFTISTMGDNFLPVQGKIEDGVWKAGAPSMVLHTSYYYNAVFMVGQDGGQSKLVTA